MVRVFCIILLFVYNNAYSQVDSISMNVLNDTIYFTYLDLTDPSDTYIYEKSLGEDTNIDCSLEFEIYNTSKNNYLLYLDTNNVWVHHFGPLPISDTIRYDHEPNIITLLYTHDKIRKDASGSFVRFDNDSIKDSTELNMLNVIDDYKKRKVKIQAENILANYYLNQNRFYLKAGEKRNIKGNLKIPYYHFAHGSSFTLDKNEIYYVDFYFHNKSQKTKEALTKTELKELKKKNIHIYGGTIHTDKKIVLIYKENGK